MTLSPDASAELDRLDGLCGRRRDREAIPGLEALLAAHPDHGVVAFLLGRAWRRLGDRARAGAVFAATAKLAPDDPHVGLGLAWSALDAGDLARAVALSTPAREVRALRGDALALWARERESVGDREAARALWLESYEARPMLDALAACERLSEITHDPEGPRAPWPIGVVQRRWLFRTLEEALSARSRARFGELDAMKQLTAGCDHTASLTARWAERAKIDRVTLFRALAARGGFCDCEVCLNASREDDADVEVLLVAGRVGGRLVKGSRLATFFAREDVEPPRLSLDVEGDRDRAREVFGVVAGAELEIPPQLVSDGLVADLAATLAREPASVSVALLVVAPDLLDAAEEPAAELAAMSHDAVTTLALTRAISTPLATRLPWIEGARAALDRALLPRVSPGRADTRTRGRWDLGDEASSTRLLVRGARGSVLETSSVSGSESAPRAPTSLVLSTDGSTAAWLEARRTRSQLLLEDRVRGERRVLGVDRFRGSIELDLARGRALVAAGEEIVAIDLASGARRVLALGEQVACSPDGATLAIARDATDTITLTDPDGRPRRAALRGRGPVFSPRGDRLAYLARADDRPEGTSYQAFVLDLAGGAPRRVGPTYEEACWLSFALDGRALVFQARVARAWIPLEDGRLRLEEKERLVLVSLDEGDASRELYATNGGSLRIVSPLAHPSLPLVALRTQDAPRLGQRIVTVSTSGDATEHVVAREPLSPMRWLPSTA